MSTLLGSINTTVRMICSKWPIKSTWKWLRKGPCRCWAISCFRQGKIKKEGSSMKYQQISHSLTLDTKGKQSTTSPVSPCLIFQNSLKPTKYKWVNWVFLNTKILAQLLPKSVSKSIDLRQQFFMRCFQKCKREKSPWLNKMLNNLAR